MLLISEWKDENPFETGTDSRTLESNQKFVDNEKISPIIVSNEVMATYVATILDIHAVIISDVVTETMSVEEVMAKYKEQSSVMGE